MKEYKKSMKVLIGEMAVMFLQFLGVLFVVAGFAGYGLVSEPHQLVVLGGVIVILTALTVPHRHD